MKSGKQLQRQHKVYAPNMAIASLKELSGVILVKGLNAGDDTLEQSNEEGIPFLSTDAETFETAGKIYELLKK